MKFSSDYWIKHLELQAHPEGGYYKETYRSESTTSTLRGIRSHSTAIYFLLEKGNFSAFHRIKSDELWHFYAGDVISIYVIYPDGSIEIIQLGLELEKGQRPQAVVPANSWFASKVAGKGSFALAGCTVAPGFDFEDFEMGRRETLTQEFPQHALIISQLTR